jgi:antitoxin (DNA-binding transcriptional repressor) of toxin-antitoxin stability system
MDGRGQWSEEIMRPAVTIEEAQTKLPELIHGLLHGEELVITEENQPIATLSRSPRTSWPCQPGSAKGKNHWMADDFDAPLDDFKEYIE